MSVDIFKGVFDIPQEANEETTELLESFFDAHGDILRGLLDSIRRIVVDHNRNHYLLMRENLSRIVHMMHESLASQVDEKLN